MWVARAIHEGEVSAEATDKKTAEDAVRKFAAKVAAELNPDSLFFLDVGELMEEIEQAEGYILEFSVGSTDIDNPYRLEVKWDENFWAAEKAAAELVLREFFSFEQPVMDYEVLSRRLYKSTECGAWLQERPHGIAIGSIVEGSDADCTTHELDWPEITKERLQAAINSIEAEADQLWQQANEEGDGLEELDAFHADTEDDPRSNGWVGSDGLP